MSCTKCHNEPQKRNSRKGLCATCTKEDDAEKARKRAAAQAKRLKAQRNPAQCRCGCGEDCRTGATYATKAHRIEHTRRLKAEAKAHRQTPRPPKPERHQKMQTMPVAASKRMFEAHPITDIQPTPGTEVRKLANPFWRPSLRNLFGDDNGQTWNAAD